jgi:hypothetical protein
MPHIGQYKFYMYNSEAETGRITTLLQSLEFLLHISKIYNLISFSTKY